MTCHLPLMMMMMIVEMQCIKKERMKCLQIINTS
jgi:hypothetical protein